MLEIKLVVFKMRTRAPILPYVWKWSSVQKLTLPFDISTSRARNCTRLHTLRALTETESPFAILKPASATDGNHRKINE